MWAWDKFDPTLTEVLLATGGTDRPGLHRESVFDFHDGLRLIASDDLYDFGRFLHVSGSVRGRLMKKFVSRQDIDYAGIAQVVHDRTLFISGRHVTLGFYHGPPTFPVVVVHMFDPPLPPGVRPSDGSIVPGG